MFFFSAFSRLTFPTIIWHDFKCARDSPFSHLILLPSRSFDSLFSTKTCHTLASRKHPTSSKLHKNETWLKTRFWCAMISSPNEVVVGHRIQLFPTFLLNSNHHHWASPRETHPKCKKTLNFPPTSMNHIAKKTRTSLISKSTSQVEGHHDTLHFSAQNNDCTIVLTKKKKNHFSFSFVGKEKEQNSLNPPFRHQTARRNHVQETTEENQQQQQ